VRTLGRVVSRAVSTVCLALAVGEAHVLARVPIDLVATAHRFRAGHRVRLQVSSGAHPRLVLNPGTGDPLATATELRPADQEIFHYRCQTRTI